MISQFKVARAQFAFLLQAFSFSNKKKMPKREKYKSFNYSWTQKWEAYFYRAAHAAAVRRVAAPYKCMLIKL
ncbi:MAG TPA: hypothetical protein DEF70_06495 [Ruminococcaceae bacterium]|nr:hypothetical protein [Oscillospiraceae bacterium]